MESLIEVRDLKVFRGDKTVLDVPRLEVNAGEVLAVIGPNGAGKSTLLLALGRLLQPDARLDSSIRRSTIRARSRAASCPDNRV